MQFFKNIISLSQAAKISGYTQDYLGYLIRTGEIKGIKKGGIWFTTEREIHSYISKQKSLHKKPTIEKNHLPNFVVRNISVYTLILLVGLSSFSFYLFGRYSNQVHTSGIQSLTLAETVSSKLRAAKIKIIFTSDSLASGWSTFTNELLDNSENAIHNDKELIITLGNISSSTSDALSYGWSTFTNEFLDNSINSLSAHKQFADNLSNNLTKGTLAYTNGIIDLNDHITSTITNTKDLGLATTASVGDSLMGASNGISDGWTSFTNSIIDNTKQSLTNTKDLAISLWNNILSIPETLRNGAETFIAILNEPATPTPIISLPSSLVTTSTTPKVVEQPTLPTSTGTKVVTSPTRSITQNITQQQRDIYINQYDPSILPRIQGIELALQNTINHNSNQTDRVYDSIIKSINSSSNNITEEGTLNDTTLNNPIIKDASITNFTATGQVTFTKVPTLAHTFDPSWPSDTSNVSDSSLYINPSSSVADGNILGLAVGGVAKFIVDAEGDVYAKNLILTGTTTASSTTIGTLSVEGNTTLGDAPSDTVNVNGTINSNIIFTDNTFDIGASGATRPRTGYFGTGVVAPLFTGALTGNVTGNVSGNAGTVTGLAVTAGQTLTVTTGGTIGSAAYTASTAYDVAGAAAAVTPTTLGLVIGTNVQAYNSNLTAINQALTTTSSPSFTAVGATTFTGALTGHSSLDLALTGGTMTGGITNSTVANPLTTLAESWIGPSSTTGIYFKGGNVGVGATTPNDKLSVTIPSGSVGDLRSIISGQNISDITIGGMYSTNENISPIGAGLAFKVYEMNVGLSEKVRILNNGNVGIGTTEPVSKLEIDKTASDTISQANADFFFGSKTLDVGLLGQQTLSSPYSYVLQAGVQAMSAFTPISLNPLGGNVGIGITTPESALNIGNGWIYADRTGGASGIISRRFNGTIGTKTKVLNGDEVAQFVGSAYQETTSAFQNIADIRFVAAEDQTSTAGGSYMIFRTTPIGSVTRATRMTISNNGNVGIGATTPLAKLHVAGNDFSGSLVRQQRSSGDVSPVTLQLFKSRGTTDSPSAVLDGDTLALVQAEGYQNADFRQSSNIRFLVDGSPSGDYVPGMIKFETGTSTAAPTARMVIKNDGNVGIGTASPVGKLQVEGSASSFLVRSTGAVSMGYGDTGTGQLIVNGNVGIGTTTPGESLTVRYTGVANTLEDVLSVGKTSVANMTAGGGGAIVFRNKNYSSDTVMKSGRIGVINTADVLNATNPAMVFQIGNAETLTEKMRITTAGNVGIGTTAPEGDLHINEADVSGEDHVMTRWSSISGGNMDLRINGGASNPEWEFNSNPFEALVFSQDGTERLRIHNNGNVGIGTTTPISKLDIYNATSGANKLLTVGMGDAAAGGAVGDYTGVLFSNLRNGTEDWYGSEIRNINSGATPGALNPRLGFFVQNTGTHLAADRIERLTISGSGSVGIGTINPGTKLEVNGTLTTRAGNPQFYSVGDVNKRLSWNLIDGNLPKLYYYDEVATTFHSIQLGGTSTDGSGLVITGGGNVGIGTTAPQKLLHIGNLISGAVSGVIRVSSRNTGGGTREWDFGSDATLYPYGFFIKDIDMAAPAFFIKEGTGDVGIGTTSPASIGGSVRTLDIRSSNDLSNSGGGIYLGTSGGSKAHIYSFGNDLFIGSTSGYTLLDGGNVGIRTTAPTGFLHIDQPSETSTPSLKLTLGTASNTNIIDIQQPNGGGTGAIGTALIKMDNRGAAPSLYFSNNGSNPVIILNNGNTGIGMSNPSVALDITGDVEYTGTLTDVSDERLKDQITTITGDQALSIITSMQAKSFIMRDSGKKEYGYIAQEILPIFPDAVSIIDPDTGYLGLNYISFIPLATESIKQLNLKLETINDIDTPNTLRDNFTAWLANAGNKITRIFTGEVCLTDPGQEAVCINRSELQLLKAMVNQSNTNSGNTGDGTDDPTCDAPSTIIDGVCTPPADDTCESPSTIVDGVCTAPTGDTGATSSDISALTTAKDTAQGLIDANATESETPGDHIVGSLATLTTANEAANGTTSDPQTTIDSQVTALNDAITAYNSAIVPEP